MATWAPRSANAAALSAWLLQVVGLQRPAHQHRVPRRGEVGGQRIEEQMQECVEAEGRKGGILEGRQGGEVRGVVGGGGAGRGQVRDGKLADGDRSTPCFIPVVTVDAAAGEAPWWPRVGGKWCRVGDGESVWGRC